MTVRRLFSAPALSAERLLQRAMRASCITLLLLVSACGKDLYSNLSEHEANQMMAILMTNGIDASKSKVGETFTLSVEEADLLRSISVLNDKGYPKSSRDSIGTIFQKSGIISSPFEERVRYTYALGEDVAETLSQIDGVVTARVHIVLPEEPQLGQPVRPSSSAVFIKHEPSVDLEFLVPQIRRLVSSSIEGLDLAAVTVVLTEAAPTEASVPSSATERTIEVLPGLAVREQDVGRFWGLLYGAAGILVVLVAAGSAGLALVLRKRRKGQRKSALVPVDAGLEPS